MGPSLPAHGWPRTLTTPLLVSRASRERGGAITLRRTRPRYINLGRSASNCPSLHEVSDTRQVVTVCSHYKSPGRFVNQKHNYLGNRIQSLKRHVNEGQFDATTRNCVQPTAVRCSPRAGRIPKANQFFVSRPMIFSALQRLSLTFSRGLV